MKDLLQFLDLFPQKMKFFESAHEIKRQQSAKNNKKYEKLDQRTYTLMC